MLWQNATRGQAIRQHASATRRRQTYLLTLKDQNDHRQASPSPRQVRRMGLASCNAIIQQGSVIETARDPNAAAGCGWLSKGKTGRLLTGAGRTGAANRRRQTYLLTLKDQSDHRQASPSPRQVRRIGLASCDAIIQQGSVIETANNRYAATGCGWQAKTKLGIEGVALSCWRRPKNLLPRRFKVVGY